MDDIDEELMDIKQSQGRKFEQLSRESISLREDLNIAMNLVEGFDVDIASIKVCH